MDKGTFASYKFKPSDVIEGLNRYFAETKANRYRRVPLEIRRGVYYNNPDCVKDIIFTNNPPDRHTRSGHVCWNYYLLCDPEEVVGVAINWLREEHDIFYTPGMEVPVEDHQLEILRTELVASRRMYHNAIEERNKFGRRLADIREAAGMADSDPTDLVKYVETLREANEELANHRVAEGWLRKENSDLAIKVSNLEEQLRVLHYEILEVFREIFDCSNGDPEGSDEETLQDILTEYKWVLKLKDAAEEKTIKYKELARENEEKAANYKDTADKYREMAKENRIQWNNTNMQLQWAQEENRKLLEKHEKLKSELDETKRRCGESVITSGGLCEDLTKERENVKRLEQKLIEIQDICER